MVGMVVVVMVVVVVKVECILVTVTGSSVGFNGVLWRGLMGVCSSGGGVW